MARYGQPESFSFKKMIGTEIATGPVTQPTNILQVNDKLTLRTYFEWSGTNGWERDAVSDALGGAPTVTYYFEDLEAGGTPIRIPGGPNITKLAVLTAQAAADLNITTYDFLNNDLYVNDDTAQITTGISGSGADLELPNATAIQGSWQVTVVLNGGPGTKVSAFSTDMLIQILK